jgi:glutamyl-tRNA synthetase
VYQLTVVADDLDMGITHVIRGDDHLANTPKQIAIYQALGRPTPHFGHLPLIQGPDRSRLSKRHGSTNLIEFAREGFLPEAMVNFLALLGWSLDAETEIMSREELIRGFSLDRINRSAAIFDRAKLEWMNGVYLRAKPAGEVVRLAREHFISRGVPAERMPEPWFASIVALEIERSRTLEAMRANLDYFFADRIESYDEKGAKKHFLSSSATQPPPAVILSALATTLAENCGTVAPGCDFDPITLEPKLRELAEKLGISFGQLIHPLRLALTGRTASPGIFDVLTGLGRERALSRIEDARRWIREKESPPPRPDPATRS